MILKRCIKCGKEINKGERSFDIINNLNWHKIGVVCENCLHTYEEEDIHDPDVEGAKIEKKPSVEEIRLDMLERTVEALCDLLTSCMESDPFYCGSKDCKDRLFDNGCPFEDIELFRNSLEAKR